MGLFRLAIWLFLNHLVLLIIDQVIIIVRHNKLDVLTTLLNLCGETYVSFDLFEVDSRLRLGHASHPSHSNTLSW